MNRSNRAKRLGVRQSSAAFAFTAHLKAPEDWAHSKTLSRDSYPSVHGPNARMTFRRGYHEP
jgi:hypothetical protein